MKKLFFTWDGIGDNLCLLAAAWNWFKQSGERPAIGGKPFYFYKKNDFIDFYPDLSLSKVLSIKGKEVIDQVKNEGYSPTFLTACGFNYLAPDFSSNVTTWGEEHLITRYCERMGFGGKVEIDFPPVRNLNPTNNPRLREALETCDEVVCIMCGGLQKYKSIAPCLSQKIVELLEKKYVVVQLGSHHDYKLKKTLDLRGIALEDAACILQKAKFFIGAVGGLTHLARSVRCPSLVLQSTAEPLNLTFYNGNRYLSPIDYCDLCSKNFRDPQHMPCYFNYKCIRNITISQIHEELSKIETEGFYPLGPQIEFAHPDPASGLEDYFRILNTKSYSEAYF